MNINFTMLAASCITILYFLLPAYLSNSGGLIFGGGRPIDGGKTDSKGNRWIGDGVTWRGLIGGTLLGTGGLVRAYSSATQAGLASSKIITKMKGFKLSVKTDYTGLGKIQYILGQRGIKILDSIYTDQVELSVLLPEEEVKPVMAEITEGTNGRARQELGDECWFAEIDGEMMVLD